MSSIISFFNTHKYNYTTSSTTPRKSYEGPYSALNKEGNHFESDFSDAYWQISFSRPVTITSYILSGKTSFIYWTKSWEISYSLTGSSFTPLQTDAMNDYRQNTDKFQLKKSINCKHFRITRKTGSCTCLAFYRFDCFGSTKAKYTCNIAVSIRRAILRSTSMIMALIIA